jgi:hypothetical protein
MALPPWLAEWYAPSDFSSIPGFPNEFPDSDWDDHIPKFHGYSDSTTLYISSFIKVVLDLSIVHGDVMMRMFHVP